MKGSLRNTSELFSARTQVHHPGDMLAFCLWTLALHKQQHKQNYKHLCHSVYRHCTTANSRAFYPVGGWAFYVNWQWHKQKYGVLSCGWARAFYVTEKPPYTYSQQHAGLWKSSNTSSYRPTVRCYVHYWKGFIQQHLIYSLHYPEDPLSFVTCTLDSPPPHKRLISQLTFTSSPPFSPQGLLDVRFIVKSSPK